MKAFIHRAIVTKKEKIDSLLKLQRGTFNKRSPKELDNIFKVDLFNLNTTKDLILPESSLDRMSLSSQEFLVNALTKYNSTFPIEESMNRNFDGFKGNEQTMHSLVEYYLRSLIMCTYEEGVTITSGETIYMDNGLVKGTHDFVINKGNLPILTLRLAKRSKQAKITPIEQGFVSNIFEMYTQYWKTPIWPHYGCVSDLNSWIFLKYDGEHIFRTTKIYKLALHNTSILSLAVKILNIIDAKV
ncbi:hypothetical protein SteCoe_38278 [Stentor coeruleus]|uniref:Uncharacterized protein n=1 Tax=Stentor coeruleus TaxID=5963 RepID=A0A1R2ALX4_9CILI|nr:hypothetical protein SteCoe_38278 [Stentor coeruleus]